MSGVTARYDAVRVLLCSRFPVGLDVRSFSTGGNHTDSRRFVTTARAYYVPHSGALPVGFGNGGVAASVTRRMHERQRA